MLNLCKFFKCVALKNHIKVCYNRGVENILKVKGLRMKVYKMTYAEVQDRESLARQYEDYISETTHGTYEIMSDDIKALEKDMSELYTDEVSPYHLTFKREIGFDIYDMLLKGELDIVLLV